MVAGTPRAGVTTPEPVVLGAAGRLVVDVVRSGVIISGMRSRMEAATGCFEQVLTSTAVRLFMHGVSVK